MKNNGIIIPVGLLALILIGWGTIQAEVKQSKKDIEKLQDTATMVTKIEVNLDNVNANMKEIKEDMKSLLKEMKKK